MSPTPTAANTGASDGPGMWMPAGALGSIRCFPRRAGGAARRRRKVQMMPTAMSTAIPIGSRAMSDPQSGMTSFEVNWRIAFQIWSNMRRGGQSLGEPAMRT